MQEGVMEDLLTLAFVRAFDSVFPLLKYAENPTTSIDFFWNTGVVDPGADKEVVYYVPEGYVDVADWLSWDLSEYGIANVKWIRDENTIWSETDTNEFRLSWIWFKAQAEQFCRIEIENTSSDLPVSAIFRGQCYFLHADDFKRLRKMVIDSWERVFRMPERIRFLREPGYMSSSWVKEKNLECDFFNIEIKKNPITGRYRVTYHAKSSSVLSPSMCVKACVPCFGKMSVSDLRRL